MCFKYSVRGRCDRSLEATSMKDHRVINTAVLFLLLGITLPAFAQKGEEEKGGGKAQPAQQHQVQPQRQQQAQPQHQQQAQQQAQPQRQQQAQPQHQQQATRQAQPQHQQQA